MSAPTLLGHVGAVSGSTISVRQFEGISSGIAIIGGRSYRVGQVGSFVRIPQGYHDLYGIIADVGATAAPQAKIGSEPRSEWWMTVQLVGEIIEATFERGISQYPALKDEVHLVTEDDLGKIYGTIDAGQVTIGRLAAAESIPVRIDLDRLVTRHSAVLGSTGSGKSTTVASLLRSISVGQYGEKSFPNARILLLDVHGEYGDALKGVAKTFRVNPADGCEPLVVPYWAMDIVDVIQFVMGNIEEKSLTAIHDRILEEKQASLAKSKFAGVSSTSLTINSPIPFSLKKLWLDLIDPELKTTKDKEGLITARNETGDAEKSYSSNLSTRRSWGRSPFLNKIGVLYPSAIGAYAVPPSRPPVHISCSIRAGGSRSSMVRSRPT